MSPAKPEKRPLINILSDDYPSCFTPLEIFAFRMILLARSEVSKGIT